MSGIGSGYDLAPSTFSPDGRVFQTEYAQKAVDGGGTLIGLRCRDGVVLGLEKPIQSKLLIKGSGKRIFHIDKHAGGAVAGLLPDGRSIVDQAVEECIHFKKIYGRPIPGGTLAERVASYVHLFNLYWYARPYGASLLIASYDHNGPGLHLVETSGKCHKYFGAAIGKGRQAAKTQVEKLNMQEMTCQQGLLEVAKILYKIHDEEGGKPFELELSWISDETNKEHRRISEAITSDIERQAKEALQEDSDYDD